MIYPNEYLDSVKEIKIELLQKNQIKGIILDVDNTLIDFHKNMPDGIQEWVKDLKEQGIKFCIVSNSNHVEKVKTVADKIEVPYLYFAKKPAKGGFLKACKLLNLDSKNVASVGDQIFTDVIGANRCQMFSILVKPIDKKDYFVTRVKRPLENFVIKQYLKKKKQQEEERK